MSYFIYRLGEFIAMSFSWSFAYQATKFLAALQFMFSKKDREAVINNLRAILPKNTPEKEIKDKAKEVFINFGLYLVEFFRYPAIDKKYIEKHFTVIGHEHIEKALKNKKGAILLTAHIGNWEIGGAVLSLLGFPVIAIALDHKDQRINDFFKKRRESKGLEVVSLGISVKKCFKEIKNNKLIAVVGDRDFSHSSYPMDFLGKTKNIPRGPAVLALRAKAPIIPVFITRKNVWNIQVECLPAIEISEKSTEKEIIKQYSAIIEEQIYKYPTQWLLFREFWKE